jgi:hypothetical protein
LGKFVAAFGRFDLQQIDELDDTRYMPTTFEAESLCLW